MGGLPNWRDWRSEVDGARLNLKVQKRGRQEDGYEAEGVGGVAFDCLVAPAFYTSSRRIAVADP